MPYGSRLLPTAFIAGILLGNAAQASVVSITPTLPPLDEPFVAAHLAGCFPAVNACVAPGGSFTFTDVNSLTPNLGGESIVAGLTYSGAVSTPTMLVPLTLTGTLTEEVLGRTDTSETGHWDTAITDLSLTGMFLGHTLTLGLDPLHDSTGGATITDIGNLQNEGPFRISSFFDVFVELQLDTMPPLTAKRFASLRDTPEPATLTLLGVGVLGLAALRRGRRPG